jgi:hypothetical protein
MSENERMLPPAKRHFLEIALPLLFGFCLIKLVIWLGVLGAHTFALIVTPAKGEMWREGIHYVVALPSVWLMVLALLSIGAYQRHWLRKNTSWFDAAIRLRLLMLFFVLWALAFCGIVVGAVAQALSNGELRLVNALSWSWIGLLTAWGLWMTRITSVSAQKFLAPAARLFQLSNLLLALIGASVIHLRNASPAMIHVARADLKRLQHVNKIAQTTREYGDKNGHLPTREALDMQLSKKMRKALQADADLSYKRTSKEKAIVCARMHSPFYLREDIGGRVWTGSQQGRMSCVEVHRDDPFLEGLLPSKKSLPFFVRYRTIPEEEEIEDDA